VNVENNTFFRCSTFLSPFGGAARFSNSSIIRFDSNILAETGGGAALGGFNLTQTSGGCNVFWNNAGGNYSGWPESPTDLEADPLFCDTEALDFSLHGNSPCVAGNTPGCGQIGAFGQGCGSVTVSPSSWAEIKSRYRKGGER
jgi:hypothetical protein